MVSINHGLKWFAAMSFVISEVQNGRFRRASVSRFPVLGYVLCGLVAVRYVPNISSLPELQYLSCLQLCKHVFAAAWYPLSYISTSTGRPSSRSLCRLHILDALAASFLLRRDDGVVLLHLMCIYVSHYFLFIFPVRGSTIIVTVARFFFICVRATKRSALHNK